MADSAILTVGLVEGTMIGQALDLVRKAGSVVVTGIASFSDVTPTLPLAMFTLFQKRLLGSLFGEANPRADIPRLLSLYREGKLLLDEVVTANTSWRTSTSATTTCWQERSSAASSGEH